MDIGIDKFSFYVPSLYIDIEDLAIARNLAPTKYTAGLGQKLMSITPISQDSVTMGVNAALNILEPEDLDNIDLVLFSTESGVDQSKSGAVYIHKLLNIQPFARCLELKQACYAGTGGLMMAINHIQQNPTKKALIIASDIARYGLNTSGEATQGAGAVAMLISANPRILKSNNDMLAYTDDVMDFWRPNYSATAFVDGKFSVQQYQKLFNILWDTYQQEQYKKIDSSNLENFIALCFHLPYSRMGKKVLLPLIKPLNSELTDKLLTNYELSTKYSQQIGNVYTASLYLSLISLLEHSNDLQAGERIALFSYGSGSVAEFFSMSLQKDFSQQLLTKQHQTLLAKRKKLSISEYEKIFTDSLTIYNNDTIGFDLSYDDAPCVLTGINQHMRQYQLR